MRGMAWFSFTDASNEVFVFRLVDGAAIAHARALLAGAADDPRIAGTVVKSEAGYNVGWSYHLDPSGVFFFEVSTEVGDSTMRYIEERLPQVGGALLPGSLWTGWSSVLVDELRPQVGTADADSLIGSRGADILFGRAGHDRLAGAKGDDHLIAGAGGDKVSGGQGNDKLSGGLGNDVLFGGAGGDVLAGDEGNDRLTGGGGPDRFYFTRHSGRDAIFDFADTGGAEDDAIDLRSYGFSSKAAIPIAGCGDDLVLRLVQHGTVTLVDYLLTHSPRDILDDLLI